MSLKVFLLLNFKSHLSYKAFFATLMLPPLNNPLLGNFMPSEKYTVLYVVFS